ncbi:MAG: hypothetical protein ACJA2G_001388 [Cognaticolwellia sp.]|jgi:hypothetical protein
MAVMPLILSSLTYQGEKYFPNVAALINFNYQDIGLTRAHLNTLQTWVAYFKSHDSILPKTSLLKR